MSEPSARNLPTVQERVATNPLTAAAFAAALMGLAWSLRFVQDDAFISFLYARNWLNGEGLTWFGTRVEGYTNFLWVAWIALGQGFGLDPISWSYAGGLSSFAVAIYAVWKIALATTHDATIALFAILLFGTNYSVACYATGGLETMAQTALLALASLRALEFMQKDRISRRSMVLVSLLLCAAALTRLDSAVLGLWVGLALLWSIARQEDAKALLACLALPLIIVLGTWLLWKLDYYGSVFPNTFAAKIGGDGSATENGLRFLGRFFSWYALWPVFGAGLIGWIAGRLTQRVDLPPASVGLLALPLVSWLAYVASVGGDFMEFRFIVPATPYLFILLAYLIHGGLGRTLGYPLTCTAIALAILGTASIRHANEFSGTSEDKALDSIATLGTFYGNAPTGNWSRLGDRLREDLRGTNARLALHPVGAIPYYSELETVDMWGLNDLWIARHGQEVPAAYPRPGHRRHATLAYLEEQSVHLVIGEPTRIARGELTRLAQPRAFALWIQSAISFNQERVQQATLVAMPLDEKEALLMWYLTPSPQINRAIVQHGWEVQRFGRGPAR